MREEPLFYNPVLLAVNLQSPSLWTGRFNRVITKLQHLVAEDAWRSAEDIVNVTGTHLAHVNRKLLMDIDNVIVDKVGHCLLSPRTLIPFLRFDGRVSRFGAGGL